MPAAPAVLFGSFMLYPKRPLFAPERPQSLYFIGRYWYNDTETMPDRGQKTKATEVTLCHILYI